MSINKVKYDWYSDTSLYLQSSIVVLNACRFIYSQILERFKKIQNILYYFI